MKGRVANQISSIIADVDFALGAPYDLQTLIDNAKRPSQTGYQDHHIVPVQRGTEDKGLSPEDEKRIEDPENIVRIPYYVHQRITNYYKEAIKEAPFYYRGKDPELGITPRQYLRGKSFNEPYKFGLDVLRKFGVIK